MTLQDKAYVLRNRISRVFSREPGCRHAAAGPARQWRALQRFQIDFLTKHGLEPHHQLIDIGCGTLRGGIPLIKLLQTGHYTGIEIRQDVLELARNELRLAGLNHKDAKLIHTTGLSSLALEHVAEYVWAFDVLIHMDDDALNGCLSFVSGHMAQGGAFYGNTHIGEGSAGKWRGFPIVRHPMTWYEQTARRFGLVTADVGSLSEHGLVDPQPEPQSRRMLRFTHSNSDQAG